MNTTPPDPSLWHLIGCLALILSSGVTVTLTGAIIYIITR